MKKLKTRYNLTITDARFRQLYNEWVDSKTTYSEKELLELMAEVDGVYLYWDERTQIIVVNPE